MSADSERTAKDVGTFYCIPTEILTMIVQSLTDPNAEKRGRYWYRDTYRFLKTLRLTHQRFADLSYINRILFTSIQLEPTQAGLTSIQRGDVSRVAEFAQSVTFITPPSWALSFEAFSQIVIAQCTKVFEERAASPGVTTSQFEKPLQEQFATGDMRAKWPLSDTQLRDGFAIYMRDAEATKALLEGSDGQLKAAWVNFLRKIGGRLRKVRFINRDCDEMRHTDYYDTPNKSTLELPYRLEDHSHHGRPEEYGCQRTTAIAGDCLFTLAMLCLGVSGLAVRQLTIKHRMTGHFAWDTIPGWEKIHLGSLEKLKFTPAITLDEHDLVKRSVFDTLPSLEDEDVEMRACEALHNLVDKSHSSLRKLKVNVDGPMTWPSRPAYVDMPSLEYLDFDFGGVHTILLKDWMARMPNLQHLGMVCSRLASGMHYSEWSNLFDAIRDHPNAAGPNPKGLHVAFEQIITCDWTEMSYGAVVCRDRETVAKRSKIVHVVDMDDVDSAFDRHWYDGVPYSKNRVLRYRLQDDDDDGDDSDEGEEGEDGEVSSVRSDQRRSPGSPV
ncbi:hypothetical protein B0T10DRAFT_495066 [Thelonectria olida]|uniref:Uncharacterized protein n=1 Tax=Thelonectria olida TaxID=1576542 RepID=A0A9P8VX46_9HYPO|nr:hypothetical protein B0T10DRAFT_495066 [Thelonectria olida]